MTSDDFRRMAMDLPDAAEGEHMGHADFRVRGKIFATLGVPDEGWGMVKLTLAQQKEFMAESPGVFVPASGAWGAGGATHVLLGRGGVKKSVLKKAMLSAWKNAAPRRMVEELGRE